MIISKKGHLFHKYHKKILTHKGKIKFFNNNELAFKYFQSNQNFSTILQ